MKKFYREYEGNPEKYGVYFSSKAKTPEEAMESITMETGGNCLGPDDFYDDAWEEALALVRENFAYAEEMDTMETAKRIIHLANEWEIEPDNLEYLI